MSNDFVRQKGDQQHRQTRVELTARALPGSLMGKPSFMRKRKQRKPKMQIQGRPYLSLNVDERAAMSGIIDTATAGLIDNSDKVRWLADEILRITAQSFGVGISPLDRARALESAREKILAAILGGKTGDAFKHHSEM
jgi:hypothetical protein